MSSITGAMISLLICFFLTCTTVQSAPVLRHTVNEAVDPTWFEGDIMLTEEQMAITESASTEDLITATTEDANRAKRSLNEAAPSSGKNVHHTWANGVVPYRMSATLGKKKFIVRN